MGQGGQVLWREGGVTQAISTGHSINLVKRLAAMAAVGTKRRQSMSARMSAIEG